MYITYMRRGKAFWRVRETRDEKARMVVVVEVVMVMGVVGVSGG